MLRAFAVTMLSVCTIWAAHAAAPPKSFPIARWIEQLASDDGDTWRAAMENLWKAGDDAVPALRRAVKASDPDVVLRVRLILSRLEWGIRHDTPKEVADQIIEYRDGDKPRKLAAVGKLLRLRGGIPVFRMLLGRETDAETRKEVLAEVKKHAGPLARERIVAGEFADADTLLEAAALVGDDAAVMDLAAFRAMRGTAKASAREFEKTKGTAKLAAYLYRAAGDVTSARRVAQKTGDADLLGYVLDEAEDYKALAKLAPKAFATDPGVLASVCWRAGDKDGFAQALAKIPEAEHRQRSWVLLSCGRPAEAIDEMKKGGSSGELCRTLAIRGQRREALALGAPAEEEQGGWLLLEKIAIAAEMGEKDEAKRLMEKIRPLVEKFGATSDSLPGGLVKAGGRAGLRAEALQIACDALDKGKGEYAPHYLFSRMSSANSDAMAMWWQYFRKSEPTAPRSALLLRLDAWFVRGEGGKGAEGLLKKAEAYDGFPQTEKAGWAAALARACVALGKPDRAEAYLKKMAAHEPLGDFYFERRRWADAAAAYEKAVKADPTAVAPRYLQGVALVRAGKVKEGKARIEVAHLLPLGDESRRYALAEALAARGLLAEATAERELLTRTAPFFSVLIFNAFSELADHAEHAGKLADAHRYFRRMAALEAFSAGGRVFVEYGSALQVPAWAHQAMANEMIAAGKLDEAMDAAKLLWQYLPEEGDLAVALVRALNKAGRGKDADAVFAECYQRLRRASFEAPRSGSCHNRAAWLLTRSGRRLDEALRHARGAAQAQPNDPGVMDTLAETHFQRGEKSAALAAARRAVSLAPPAQTYFASQVKRIEKGDPKAELPPEPR